MKLFKEMPSCRACGSEDLRPLLNLGDCAVSDFPKRGEGLDYAPLALVQCQNCEMVQLSHAVRRDRLYRNYYYRSGINGSMVDALADVVNDASERVHLQAGDTVLDIGSNDGTLLDRYPPDIRKIGFEPSNLAFEATGKIYHEYFPSKIARPPIGGCKVVTAIAMFYDLEYPAEFLQGVREWLAPGGIFVLQMPDLYTMLRQNAFDNICHEHLCYWPTRALYRLALSTGLVMFDMVKNSVNGGSVRYYFRPGAPDPRVWADHQALLYGDEVSRFTQRVEHLRSATLTLIRALRAQGKSVWAYGASTKGNTLLQYYGLGRDLITAVADRNPEKWGRTMVTGIPITSEEAFRTARPDYALVLPWAFIDNFRAREQEWLRHGEFIVPLPDLRVLGGLPNAELHPPVLEAIPG